jgi:hypothetical protein
MKKIHTIQVKSKYGFVFSTFTVNKNEASLLKDANAIAKQIGGTVCIYKK